MGLESKSQALYPVELLLNFSFEYQIIVCIVEIKYWSWDVFDDCYKLPSILCMVIDYAITTDIN